MRFTGSAVVIALAVVAAACGLTPADRLKIDVWQAEAARLGHPEVKYEEYVDPETAYSYGFLPLGIAGFYVHRPGLGLSGFFWPASILWMPSMARGSAERYNLRELARKMKILHADAARRPRQPEQP